MAQGGMEVSPLLLGGVNTACPRSLLRSSRRVKIACALLWRECGELRHCRNHSQMGHSPIPASCWPTAASAGDRRSPALASSAFQEAGNISAFPQAPPGSQSFTAVRGGCRTLTHMPLSSSSLWTSLTPGQGVGDPGTPAVALQSRVSCQGSAAAMATQHGLPGVGDTMTCPAAC